MQIETLRDVWAHGARIKMRCAHGRPDGMKHRPHCLFTADLDVQTLVCTRGWDFPFTLLASRLRCPRCGSRRIGVMLHWPSNPARIGTTGTNG